MVRVLPMTDKGSIGFLLNSPAASADLMNITSKQYPRSSAPAGPAPASFNHLLHAATLAVKHDVTSTTTHSSSSAVSSAPAAAASSSGLHASPSGSASAASGSASASTMPQRHSSAVVVQRPGRPPVTQEVEQTLTKRRKRQNIKCELCGRTFGDSSSVRKHKRVVHYKIKEFKCDVCDKTFAEKSNRSKHFIAAHLNQRSHSCADCGKEFNFTDGLRRHRNNVHLGLRPYPCLDCNTSYKQKTHLLKHRQSVHGIPIPPTKRET